MRWRWSTTSARRCCRTCQRSPTSATKARRRRPGMGCSRPPARRSRSSDRNALALANNIRTPLLPDVPTLADLGYKGAPSETWYGLFAPAGTPKPIIDRLNGEIVKVVSDPGFREIYIISRGLVPAIDTTEE